MKLIGLLLLGLISLVEGKVNRDPIPFRDCIDISFVDRGHLPTVLTDQRTHPDPNRYKQICQIHLEDDYQYATLYDTFNRIPVYSAFKYSALPVPSRPTRDNWFIEPQLDINNGGVAMTTEGQVPANRRGVHQALNGDYLYSNKDKGHLFPHSQSSVQDVSQSSFTLTNAAPQANADNIAWFNQVENVVRSNIRNRCPSGVAYVVTGVIPGQIRINTATSQNRVNIPSHYWSAFCCRAQSQNYISEGYIKVMSGNGQGQLTSYGTAGNPALAQMNAALTTHYGQQFRVFGQQAGCS